MCGSSPIAGASRNTPNRLTLPSAASWHTAGGVRSAWPRTTCSPAEGSGVTNAAAQPAAAGHLAHPATALKGAEHEGFDRHPVDLLGDGSVVDPLCDRTRDDTQRQADPHGSRLWRNGTHAAAGR